MKGKISTLLMIAAALMLIISGCGGSRDQRSSLSGEITFLTTNIVGKDTMELFNRVKQRFETKYPATKVNLIFQNGVYLKQLQDLADNGKMPDVFLGNTPIVKEFHAKGLLKDLRPLAKLNGDEITDYFEESLLINSMENGKLISIPIRVTVPKLLYSKAFLQKAGIPEPAKDMTWQDFAEISKAIKGKTNGNNTYSVLFPLQLQLLSSLALSNGGSFTVDGRTFKGYMDEKKSAEALSWYANLAKDGLINTDFVEDSAHLLVNGTAAMYVSYTDPSSKDRESIGVLPFPKFADGIRAVNSVSAGMAVSEKTKHPDVAWAFLKFIAMDKNESTVEVGDKVGGWGVSKPIVEPHKNEEFFRVNTESYPYVKKDMYDWNVNIMNVSFAKINYQLKQLLSTGDFNTELSTLTQLVEDTLK